MFLDAVRAATELPGDLVHFQVLDVLHPERKLLAWREQAQRLVDAAAICPRTIASSGEGPAEGGSWADAVRICSKALRVRRFLIWLMAELTQMRPSQPRTRRSV